MNVRVVLILALAFIMAALIHGGVYHMVVAGSTTSGVVAFRVNRFTGSVLSCVYSGCEQPRRN